MVKSRDLGGSAVSAQPRHLVPLASAKTRPEQIYVIGKRALDIALSTLVVIVEAPIFLATVILIRIESPDPALFLQERVERHRVCFRLLKFRTMYQDAGENAHKAHHHRLVLPDDDESKTLRLPDDDRVTPFGRFLRKRSLDEFPNV